MQNHWKLVTWFLGIMLVAFLTAMATNGYGVALGIVVGCVVGGFVYFIGKAPFDGRPSDESDHFENPQNSPGRAPDDPRHDADRKHRNAYYPPS